MEAHLIPVGVNPYLDAEIRKLAEVVALDLMTSLHSHHGMLSAHAEGALVEACLDQLCDLSRPASRDTMARWLARHHGSTVGATAPGWGPSRRADTTRRWALGTPGEARLFFIDRAAADYERTVPGISAITDPAEAMRAACLAAVGRSA